MASAGTVGALRGRHRVRLSGPRNGQRTDLVDSCPLKNAGNLVHRRTCRDDVIDDQYVLVLQ